MAQELKEDIFLDKVILFLVFLVGAVLIFNQFQYTEISSNIFFNALSFLLIFALIGLVAWLLLQKKEAASHSSGQHHAEHEPKSEKTQKTPLTFHEKLSYGMVALAAVLILFNQVQISQASSLMSFKSGLTFKSASAKTPVALTGDPTKDAMAIIIPRGTPFYGESLGVSFDDPIRSLEIIAQLDPAYGRNKVQLTAEERNRYIRIDTTPTITCEFCCGVKTAVTKDGSPTCGCKHSWAIRGLTAYLVKNYPQLSDDEIKKEVVKWKGLFFPKQMIQRYIQETQAGQYTPDIASLLLDVDEKKLKGMKSPVASQDNAKSSGNTAASVNDLPSMVGGC